jgi:hypothetical protein
LVEQSGLLVKRDNSAMAWQHREFDSPTVHHTNKGVSDE